MKMDDLIVATLIHSRSGTDKFRAFGFLRLSTAGVCNASTQNECPNSLTEGLLTVKVLPN
jgi:hypothetical protein